MKDIIGLAVLTSPLFLVVPWLVVAVLVAVKVSQLPKMGVAKLAAGMATLVVVFLLPFADEIAGRIYFNHLCSTEAGVKVYQTVELPAEYWDRSGKAQFFKANGDVDYLLLNDKFGEHSSTSSYSALFGIDETYQQVVDKSNQSILGEVVNFMYWGGWISRNFSPHNTAVDCKEFHGNPFWHNFYSSLFIPATSSK